jgi:ArsR family metal-binding transcriptional regulator
LRAIQADPRYIAPVPPAAPNFLESLALVKTLPCLAEPGRIIVIAEPSPALDAVLPLIAATAPSIIAFNPRATTLTLRRQPGFITFYRDQVIITQAKDVAEGLELLSAIRDLVDRCWQRRDTITPATDARRAPRPLDVWSLLPRTNCKGCGESTCMAFASLLLLRRRKVDECPTLAQDVDFAPRRAQLMTLL